MNPSNFVPAIHFQSICNRCATLDYFSPMICDHVIKIRFLLHHLRGERYLSPAWKCGSCITMMVLRAWAGPPPLPSWRGGCFAVLFKLRLPKCLFYSISRRYWPYDNVKSIVKHCSLQTDVLLSPRSTKIILNSQHTGTTAYFHRKATLWKTWMFVSWNLCCLLLGKCHCSQQKYAQEKCVRQRCSGVRLLSLALLQAY